jgi:hypothetical protein
MTVYLPNLGVLQGAELCIVMLFCIDNNNNNNIKSFNPKQGLGYGRDETPQKPQRKKRTNNKKVLAET